jgi:DNA-binding beta-propeller fold protein YncE
MRSRLTRRQAIKAGASAAAVAPLILGAQDKAGTKAAVVGSGEHTYECIHDWGMANLPTGHSYGGASHGTAFDKAGNIYITHKGGPGSIFVFDPAGTFVKTMAKEHQANGHGIDIREEGGTEYMYLAPANTGLAYTKMTLDGEVVWQRDRAAIQKDSGKYEGKARFRPTNISFRPDGGYYLGDGYGSAYLHQYDKNDKYVRTIGGKGKGDGQFNTPHGQWLDERDGTAKLVVADRANKRLQWFDMDGKHLKTLGGFLFPADIDVQGDVMLVPDLHCRITLLDKADKVISHLGDDAEWRKAALAGFKMRKQRAKWKPGLFIHPHDAAFDKDGNIFVAEWVETGRVTKLRKV